jgi:hypothetical protein
MAALTKYIIGLSLALLAALSMGSCSNSSSLQRYFVDKQADDNFIKVDLATSLLQSDSNSFSQEENDVLETVKKINVIAFALKDSNKEAYESEKQIVTDIIGQEDYKTLLKMGSNNMGATLKYLGEEDAIDELIVFASDSEKGFAVFRLLGDNMRPDAMLKLMQSIDAGDVDVSSLESIGSIFGDM